MVKETRTVCDFCGRDAGTKRYVIVFPEYGRKTVDLCGDHRGYLDELEAKLTALGHKTGGPPVKGRPVVTAEELQAEVRRAKRRTARKKT